MPLRATVTSTTLPDPEPDLHFADLKVEVDFIQKQLKSTRYDTAFVTWFQTAAITGDLTSAQATVMGQAHDQGVDGIVVNDDLRTVTLTQAKFHQSLGRAHAKEEDFQKLVKSSTHLHGSDDAYILWRDDFPPDLISRVDHVRTKIRDSGYALHLYFATTGSVSELVSKHTRKSAREAGAELTIFASAGIRELLRSYREGLMPPIPSADLMVSAIGMEHEHATKPIRAIVCSVNGLAIGHLVRQYAPRIFARNVRGFLGPKGRINARVGESVREQPATFWFLNNGATIVCSDYSHERRDGQTFLHMSNPQIVNGQQTSVVLESVGRPAGKAELLVRIIAVGAGDQAQREELISQLVLASNSQNSILASDLVSNDAYQTSLERQFRAMGYHYLRKRGIKYRSREAWGLTNMRQLKKEEVARAVAGTLPAVDPRIVRAGKEGLFVEPLYSKIFSERPPQDFLNRYWLMQAVKRAASGHPSRQYAKWHVLHLVWEELYDHLGRLGRPFRLVSEEWRHWPDVMEPLDRAIDQIYRAALDYHKAEAGTGARALDASNFFYQVDRQPGLSTLWRDPSRPFRQRFQVRASRFVYALEGVPQV